GELDDHAHTPKDERDGHGRRVVYVAEVSQSREHPSGDGEVEQAAQGDGLGESEVERRSTEARGVRQGLPIPEKGLGEVERVSGVVDKRRAEGWTEIVEEDEAGDNPQMARPDCPADGLPGGAELPLSRLDRRLADGPDPHAKRDHRKDGGYEEGERKGRVLGEPAPCQPHYNRGGRDGSPLDCLARPRERP